MNQKISRLKCCGLYALGIGLFLTAQSSVVSESPLQFSYPARAGLNIFAVLSFILGSVIWKPRRRLSAAVRFVLPAILIAAILLLGFRSNQTASLFMLPPA